MCYLSSSEYVRPSRNGNTDLKNAQHFVQFLEGVMLKNAQHNTFLEGVRCHFLRELRISVIVNFGNAILNAGLVQ